jgi:hypothetical protein
MTAQAREVLEFKGNEYQIWGAPLNQYLDIHQEVVFEDYTTAHYKGYQGYWKLENSKLYLANLESANHSLQTLFDTSHPVHATWFTGSIEMGFGNFESDDWYDIHEHHLWLFFEDGVLIKRHVIKLTFEPPIFTFGKYKNVEIEKVLTGNYGHKTVYHISAAQKYVEDIFEFHANHNFSKYLFLPHIINSKFNKITKINLSLKSYKYLITSSYIAVNDNLDNKIFLDLIEEVLSGDFSVMFQKTKSDEPVIEFCESSFLMSPDFSYIKWVIDNVDNFAIPPDLIQKPIIYYDLEGFQLNRINDFILLYKPILIKSTYTFSEEILQKNESKFESLSQLKYIAQDDVYIYNLSEEEMFHKFGYYLYEDKEYQQLKEKFTKKPHKFSSDDDSYDDFELEYDKYDGAYGYDDDTIDNAFNGDPENYWNID